MANSWGKSGTVTDFIFLGSKVTVVADCRHEIKKKKKKERKEKLASWKKSYGNLDSNRDIALPTKVRMVKAMVFPVVMYGCES